MNISWRCITRVSGEQYVEVAGTCLMPRLHAVNLDLPKLWELRTMDEGRVRYGCTIWDVQGQKPHLEAVLTMDGETLVAAITIMMMLVCYFCLLLNFCFVLFSHRFLIVAETQKLTVQSQNFVSSRLSFRIKNLSFFDVSRVYCYFCCY